jgi:hypothetical protein
VLLIQGRPKSEWVTCFGSHRPARRNGFGRRAQEGVSCDTSAVRVDTIRRAVIPR